MTLARTRAVALFGVDGHLVDVEATTTSGPPGFYLDGLPNVVLAEVRDRVRAAIRNSAQDLPNRHLAVRLLPISLPKLGSGFDLSIAIAILAAHQALPADACTGMVMIGELGLDGRVRPTPGVLPAVLAAADADVETVVVPYANAAEASLVPGIRVIAVGSLAELVARLRHGASASDDGVTDMAEDDLVHHGSGLTGRSPAPSVEPYREPIYGDAEARRMLEISAAGGHSIALVGPPGSEGRPMLAEHLPALLPDLDPEAAQEVTAIHSVASGTLPPDRPLITRPPLYVAHPTISRAALVGGGGGRLIVPGGASLAHRGVLFLDRATDFAGGALETLRASMDSGEIVILRGGVIASFPARFTLAMTADLCPCRASLPRECTCTLPMRRHSFFRLPLLLLDRIDIKHRLDEPTHHQLRERLHAAESSQAVADRVQEARERARHRLADLPWRTNAEVPGRELDRRFAPPPDALDPIIQAIADGRLSDRGAYRVIRTAWTLADLAGADQPNGEHISAAFHLRDGLTGTPRT